MSPRTFLLYLFGLLAVIAFPAAKAAAIGERRDRQNREFTGGTGWGSTREEIMENRDRRRRQLRNLVNSMRKKLADHSAGEIQLSAKEKADMERRIDLYSRKIEMMNDDLEDHDIERIIARTANQNDRRSNAREDILAAALSDKDEL